MREYVISRGGQPIRRVSLPDTDDVQQQLEDGETAEPIALDEPRPGSVLQL